MKVVLVAHNATVEGAGIAFANICRSLADYGVEVIAVVPGHKGVAELVSGISNVKVEVIRQIRNEAYPSANGLRNTVMYIPRLIRLLYFRIQFRKKLEAIIRRESPDLIHSNTGTLRIPSYLSEKYNIPHVWHVRECQTVGCHLKPFGGEECVRKLFSRANNHCIFITKSVASYYGFSENKDTVIYDGVFTTETAQSLKNFIPTKKNVILFVGLLSEIKGVPMILEAFERISEEIPNYELWLVGKDRIDIHNKIQKLRSASKIRYLGVRNDVYKLMAESRLLVVASEYEGFGFITAEAMLNHTLVAGRDIAGTKEQMDNALQIKGKELAMRFNTTEELADTILKVAHMPEADYTALTDEAYDVVSQLYTTEGNATRILDFYKKIISDGN